MTSHSNIVVGDKLKVVKMGLEKYGIAVGDFGTANSVFTIDQKYVNFHPDGRLEFFIVPEDYFVKVED